MISESERFAASCSRMMARISAARLDCESVQVFTLADRAPKLLRDFPN